MTNEEIQNKINQLVFVYDYLGKEINVLKGKLNQVPQEIENLGPYFEKPNVGEQYWRIDSDNQVVRSWWNNQKEDFRRLYSNNVFLTEQEALKEAKYRELRAKYIAYVKEYNGDWVADWSDVNQRKYKLGWVTSSELMCVSVALLYFGTDYDFYFKDEDFRPFIQKRMTDVEISAVITHDLSVIEVGDVR